MYVSVKRPLNPCGEGALLTSGSCYETPFGGAWSCPNKGIKVQQQDCAASSCVNYNIPQLLLNADKVLRMPSRPNSVIILQENSKPGRKNKSNKNEKNKEKVSIYVPNIQEPSKRAELLKYWINLSLDEKTANKMLWISDNGSKARRRVEEVCPVLDRPERYEYSPQVLTKESIWNMRAYWEVECCGWVVVGATLEGAGRRANSGPSGLGENEESWGLCWAGTRYQIWFNGINKDIMDVPFCSTMGMYVDQPAGIISFYVVNGDGAEREVKLLHRVKTNLDKKVLPGFWMGIQSACTLQKREE